MAAVDAYKLIRIFGNREAPRPLAVHRTKGASNNAGGPPLATSVRHARTSPALSHTSVACV